MVSSDGGACWSSWLCNSTTSCKVAGSVPDGVTGIFHPHNPSGRTVVSNRNGNQEYFLEGKGGRCVGVITLPPSCAHYLETCPLNSVNTLQCF